MLASKLFAAKLRAGTALAVVLCCVATTSLATPHIQHWQSASGAKVLFVENHDIPMLDVAVSVAAGSSFDTAEKSGVAGMTQHLLDLGTAQSSEDDISRGMADIGAQLGGSFDQDRASVSLRTLSSERDQALRLMAGVLQQPVFPEAILAREKARVVAALKEAETQPASIADKAFQQAVFGAHPYALPVSGEVASVEKITVQDLQDFYRTHYSASRAVVAIMGDVTQAQAEAIAQQLTAALPVSAAPPALPAVAMQIAASEQRIPHPASQSHILIGAPGMSRTDPDYFPLYVGNYILGGGGFVSRLMNEVREKRGLAYSVYSYFMPLKQPGALQIGLQTKKEQADEALKLVRYTLAEFIAKGPTEKELLGAKQNIIGGFPLRIDSNRKILDYLSVIGFYDLPLTYLDDFTGKIERVTVAQIHEAFARHIHPAQMATVIVGAPEVKETSGVKNK
ncbi:MAG: peptidase M16 [Gallionellales bacterium CG_4_10_14_3_um_filter_54_96]|nr:MAG: peptidase M16 [Gallionellaceae bacterium CG1_02_56_997]PIV14835.1 MAG: peptidase M16 [Gallionellales bacterium CG03_land_8_20_14_0_80_55_15]PIV91931.1 MAG: peptidase M16 [Gallionellales bacterium CG17_big_fil_post_rev_8_21_14_2_50_54_146]PIX04680.1 MAG: peptidase M16 [Gallionellales bacterium CG_4_8_14_3_um_filter_54_18]PIY07133.1 MAG: peptidase M16 [Gallionellales bacterium CG_4_10_14_3_um_filter_54_96]HCJ51918.1 peptidase M16 [Gallionella sp.]